MTETEYVVSDTWVAPRDVTSVEDFAVVVGDALVLRKRSNGQTFAMTYKTEGHARHGLARARAHLPEAELWRRREH